MSNTLRHEWTNKNLTISLTYLMTCEPHGTSVSKMDCTWFLEISPKIFTCPFDFGTLAGKYPQVQTKLASPGL